MIEATVVDLSLAAANLLGKIGMMATTRERRVSIQALLFGLNQQASGDEDPCLWGFRRTEESHGIRPFDDAATMQQNNLASQTPSLTEIVSGHDNLDAARRDGADDIFYRLGRGGVKARRRLVEEEDGGRASQRAGESQSLLFAAR